VYVSVHATDNMRVNESISPSQITILVTFFTYDLYNYNTAVSNAATLQQQSRRQPNTLLSHVSDTDVSD